MHKILVIAEREYLAAIRSRAFLVGLLLLPIMMFGGIAAQAVLKEHAELEPKRFAVVDRTPTRWLWPVLEGAAGRWNSTHRFDPRSKKPIAAPFLLEQAVPSADQPAAIEQQRYELSQRVLRGELSGFLEIGAEVAGASVSPGAPGGNASIDRYMARYQSDRPAYVEFPNWADQVLSAAIQLERGQKAGLSPAQASAVIQRVPLMARSLSRLDPHTERIVDSPEESPLNAIIVPMSLTVLMLMMLMVGTSPLMQSVIEEKMQRIAEVLLASVRPGQLMTGKLLGMVAVSLSTIAIYLVGAYAAAHYAGLANRLPPQAIAWFLLFQVLGVVMFGSLFIAIGAACTDAKEAQSLLMPVMFLATAPVFALGHILRDPNSTLAVGLSLFPFATPMLMTSRLALPAGVPLWQPLVGTAGVLLTTVACVYASARIVRVGLLMQGKGARFRDLWKWVFSA